MSHGLSRWWRIEAQLKAILPTPLRTMECLGFPGAKTPDIFIYLALLGSTGQRSVFSSILRADLGRRQLQGVRDNAAVSRGAGLLATRRRSRTPRWPSRTGLKQDGGARKLFQGPEERNTAVVCCSWSQLMESFCVLSSWELGWGENVCLI